MSSSVGIRKYKLDTNAIMLTNNRITQLLEISVSDDAITMEFRRLISDDTATDVITFPIDAYDDIVLELPKEHNFNSLVALTISNNRQSDTKVYMSAEEFCTLPDTVKQLSLINIHLVVDHDNVGCLAPSGLRFLLLYKCKIAYSDYTDINDLGMSISKDNGNVIITLVDEDGSEKSILDSRYHLPPSMRRRDTKDDRPRPRPRPSITSNREVNNYNTRPRHQRRRSSTSND